MMDNNWKYLIILDACRYDYFERVWAKYLEGTLEKRVSAGSSTNEWRDKSFPGFYEDIFYISANPQICANSAVYGYTAGEHFGKVFELWRTHWDTAIGTVRPDTATSAAINIINKHRDKRFIIHYLQPHAPYLSISNAARGYLHADINTVRKLVDAETRQAKNWLCNRIIDQISKALDGTRILTNQPQWVLRKLLGVSPRAPMESAWRAVGREQLCQAYADNLNAVLKQVAELVKYLSDEIVVTSDHGEFLGEGRRYGHPTGCDHPILREVPWLTIKQSANAAVIKEDLQEHLPQALPATCEADIASRAEQEELSDKLRSLGYLD